MGSKCLLNIPSLNMLSWLVLMWNLSNLSVSWEVGMLWPLTLEIDADIVTLTYLNTYIQSLQKLTTSWCCMCMARPYRVYQYTYMHPSLTIIELFLYPYWPKIKSSQVPYLATTQFMCWYSSLTMLWWKKLLGKNWSYSRNSKF